MIEKCSNLSRLIVFHILILVGFYAVAQESSTDLSAELRFRYEQADDSVNDVANAYTGRLALKWEGGNNLLRAIIEIEHVSAFLGEEYNDGGSNRKTEYAVIADPVGTEINQGYLLFNAHSDWDIRLGRQELAHRAYPWQRYAGTVSWRQNEQTMDALSVAFVGDVKLNFHGAFIKNVNRIFGENNEIPTRANFELDGLMLTGNYEVTENMKLDAFMFNLDFDDAMHLSSNTIGARVDGSIPMDGDFRILYGAEFAWQEPSSDGLESTTYRMLQGGMQNSAVKLLLKNELLGSGGSNSFQTPLATLHIHQGWADRFLATPANGISNTAFNASGKLGDVKCTFEFNSYSSDEGGHDYGSEYGTSCSYSWLEGSMLSGWTIGAKFTSFSADSDGAMDAGISLNDTNKFWFWFQRNFDFN